MTVLFSVVEWLTRHACAHQNIVRRQAGWIGLECLACGRRTPGITLSTRVQPVTTATRLVPARARRAA